MQGGAVAALQLFRQPVRQDGVDSSARDAGRFGSFGFRAVGKRQNDKKATAAVTQYGY
jgi:hypothetical protein